MEQLFDQMMKVSCNRLRSEHRSEVGEAEIAGRRRGEGRRSEERVIHEEGDVEESKVDRGTRAGMEEGEKEI
eukprot:493458-Hanusia_phi.AAC.1